MGQKAKASAKKRTVSNGSGIFKLPDVLGDEGRRQTLHAVLRDLQDQRFRLELMMNMNDHDLGDVAPGTESKSDPEGKTYRQRHREIDGLEGRLRDNYSDLLTPAEEIED